MAADAGAERSKALRHTTSCECCLLGVMRVRTHDHPQRPTCVTHTRTHTRELASIRKHTHTQSLSLSLSLSLFTLSHTTNIYTPSIRRCNCRKACLMNSLKSVRQTEMWTDSVVSLAGRYDDDDDDGDGDGDGHIAAHSNNGPR